jgi:hypothetical protein
MHNMSAAMNGSGDNVSIILVWKRRQTAFQRFESNYEAIGNGGVHELGDAIQARTIEFGPSAQDCRSILCGFALSILRAKVPCARAQRQGRESLRDRAGMHHRRR